jgi:Flp pilus assembly protein TadD
MTFNQRKPTFSYTSRYSQPDSNEREPVKKFRFTFKLAPLLLVLAVGLALVFYKGPSGVAGKMIDSMGGKDKKALKGAYTMIVDGDFTGAAQAASSVIRSNPNNALAYHILGLADARRGLIEEAADNFTKATTLDPKFTLAWSNLGVVEENRGEFGRALLAYQAASDLDPKKKSYLEAVSKMKAVLMGKEDWVQREKAEEKLLLDGMGALNRGEPNDLAYAENIFRTLMGQRQYDVAVRNLLGLALARQGRLDEAEKIFHDAVDAEPGYADAWYNLGVVHRAQGKLENALADFKAAESAGTLDSFKAVAAKEIADTSASIKDANP